MNLREFRDYQKVCRTIDSCATIQHYLSTANLVYNYGRMYGFNRMWTKLDKKITAEMSFLIDQHNYRIRREDTQ